MASRVGVDLARMLCGRCYLHAYPYRLAGLGVRQELEAYRLSACLTALLLRSRIASRRWGTFAYTLGPRPDAVAVMRYDLNRWIEFFAIAFVAWLY